jgi:NADP-dependent 3-hydroxy acid dehydrogenase YdfG
VTQGPLAGRAGLVTGAAKGIGAAVLEAVAARGAGVVGMDVDAAALDVVVDRVTAAGGRASAAPGDVSRFGDVETAAAACADRHGQVDFVVANAGVGNYSLMSDGDPEAWRRLLEVNLLGAAYTVRAVLADMKRRGSGDIVLMASIAGRESWVGEPIYIASKWGMVGLARSLREECAPHQVRVTVVEPTMVDTPLVRATEDGRRELEQYPSLSAADVARIVVMALEQPPGVSVGEIVLRAVGPEIA